MPEPNWLPMRCHKPGLSDMYFLPDWEYITCAYIILIIILRKNKFFGNEAFTMLYVGSNGVYVSNLCPSNKKISTEPYVCFLFLLRESDTRAL